MREYTHAKIDVIHLAEDIVLTSAEYYSTNVPEESYDAAP